MKNETIKRQVLSTYKYTFEFFTYLPKVYEGNSNDDTKRLHLSINPILIFKMNTQSNAYSPALTFKISPKTLSKTMDFFHTIYSWFFDDELKDLFIVNDSDELVFNADYSKLYALTRFSEYDSGNILKATPAIIEQGNEFVEGAYFYFNNSENILKLTVPEIAMIYDFLKTFRFNEELLVAMESIRYHMVSHIVHGTQFPHISSKDSRGPTFSGQS